MHALIVLSCSWLSVAAHPPCRVACASQTETQASTSQGGLYFDQLVYDGHRRSLILVNGYLPPAKPQRVRLLGWDGARRQWEPLPGVGPSMRTLSGAVHDTRRGRLVLFGGLGNTGLADQRGDTWEWDGEEWFEAADTSVGTRDHHALVYDEARARTVLYGGVTSDESSPSGTRVFPTDTWEWDASRWTKVAELGPSGRGGIGLAYDATHKEVVLFGGVGEDPRRLGDTWTWDGEAWQIVSEEGPRARSGHAMAFDRRAGLVILFGGTTGPEHLDDTWQWDGQRWTEIAVAGPRPGKRVGAGMTHDAEGERIVLYDGSVREDGRAQPSDELWAWNDRHWTQVR